MSNWWDEAPLADAPAAAPAPARAAAPAAGGDWWEAAPIAGDDIVDLAPVQAVVPSFGSVRSSSSTADLGPTIGADGDYSSVFRDPKADNDGILRVLARGGLGRVPELLANLVELPANANEALVRAVGGDPDEPGVFSSMRKALRSGAGSVRSLGYEDDMARAGWGDQAKTGGDALAAVNPMSDMGMVDRLKTVGTFVPETLAASLPDMLATVNPATLAGYIGSRTNEIAENRATSDKRADVGLGDLALGSVAAPVEAYLERFTTMRLLPQGTTMATPGVLPAIARIAKELGIQGSLGGVEELVPYLAENVGTATGATGQGALETFVAGALAEGALGATVQTGKEGLDARGRARSVPPAGPASGAAPAVAPAPADLVAALTGALAPQGAPAAPAAPAGEADATGPGDGGGDGDGLDELLVRNLIAPDVAAAVGVDPDQPVAELVAALTGGQAAPAAPAEPVAPAAPAIAPDAPAPVDMAAAMGATPAPAAAAFDPTAPWRRTDVLTPAERDAEVAYHQAQVDAGAADPATLGRLAALRTEAPAAAAIAPKPRTRAAKADKTGKPMDLLRVVAANGGLNRGAFKAQGVDPAEFTRRAGFNYVFRKNGGMGLSDLREFMQQEGYLPRDPEGGTASVDDNDALDVFDRAFRGGEEVFSDDQADAVAAYTATMRQADDEFEAELAADPAFADEADVDPFADDFDDGEAAWRAEQKAEIAALTERAYAAGVPDSAIIGAAFDATNDEHHRQALERLISGSNRNVQQGTAGRTGQRSVEAGEGAGRLELEAPAGPAAEASTRPASLTAGLFGAPTTADMVNGLRRSRDADRDGRTATGRTDVAAGDGELFAGPRPAQARVDEPAAAPARDDQDAQQRDDGALENTEEPFYSALARSIETAKGAPKRGAAGAWKQWLDGAQRRGEFRQAERDWLGLDAWLDGRTTTTREELAAFVRANEVQVQEVTLGGDATLDEDVSPELGEWLEDAGFDPDDLETPDAWREAAAQIATDASSVAEEDGDDSPDFTRLARLSEEATNHARRLAGGSVAVPPKFAEYQVPGGQNYRELLLTLPPQPLSIEEARKVLNAKPDAELSAADLHYAARKKAQPYRSSHFEQENILAHVRFNERTAADGKRVLFLEEIQSDWHQAGRRSGYGTRDKGHPVDQLRAVQLTTGRWRVEDGRGDVGEEVDTDYATEAEATAAAERLTRIAQDWGNASGTNFIPDAPFKGTDEWAMLAFKRMVRHAAENGFDRIAWTTGAQQADRYDLSKQVSEVEYVDGARLIVRDLRGSVIYNEDTAPEGIADVIGKDPAEKLLAAQTTRRDGFTFQTIRGDGLKVGGDGMRAFYDRILPAAVNKWGKKFGARVAPTALTMPNGLAAYETLRVDGSVFGSYGTQAAAESAMGRAGAGAKWRLARTAESEQHSIDVTPAMADAAMEGQPLFNREPGTDNGGEGPVGDLAIRMGEAEADKLGLREAVNRALGPVAEKVIFMRGYQGLPERLRTGIASRMEMRNGVKTAALYDTRTRNVYVFTDVVRKPDRAVWNAAHEIAGHEGIRALLGTDLDAALEVAGQNPTVAALAKAIAKERGLRPTQDLLAIEEALSELAAAVRTGDYDHIEARYKVPVPEGIRATVARAIDNFLRRLRALFNRRMAEVEFSDADVRELLENAWKAAGGKEAPGFDPSRVTVEGVDGLDATNYTPEQVEFMRKAGLGAAVDTRTSLQRAIDWARGKKPDVDGNAIIQGTFDQFHGIKRAVAEKGATTPERNAYLAARQVNTGSTMEAILLYGAPKLVDGVLRVDRSIPGLLQALGPVAKDMPQFLGWMVARRAQVLKRQGRENLLSDADIAAGMALATGKEAAFKQAAGDYLRLKNAILDLAEASGTIDPGARAVWDSVEYIPFYRETETGAAGPGTRQGLANQSSGIKRLRGGDSALKDPLANIIQNFTRLVDSASKNRATLLAVDELGAPYFRKAPLAMKAETIPLDQVRKHLLAAGTDQGIIDAMPTTALEGVAKMLAVKAPEGDDVVRVMRKGKAEFYHVDDPLLLRSLTAFNETPTHWGVKPFVWAKQMLTAGATATPEFLVANTLRDTGEAWATSANRFIPLVDTVRGAVERLRESELSQDLMMAGSSFHSGLFTTGRTDDTAKAINRALRKHGVGRTAIQQHLATIYNPVRWWDVYRTTMEASEMGSRIMLAQRTLEAGGSFLEAAHEAKDFLDFTMRGDDRFVQFFTSVLPFLNARLQGGYRLARVGTTAGRRGRLASRMALIATASTSLLLWNLAMYGEEYDELPDWDKDAYWHIGPGQPWHTRIPKPFEIGLVAGTFVERLFTAVQYQLTEGTKGDRPKATFGAFMRGLVHTMAIDPIPQAVRPPLEVQTNHNRFFDSPIEAMGDKFKAPEDRYGPTTSETMRQLSSGMTAVVGDDKALSPKQLEHLWRGYTAGIGTYLLNTSDWVVRGLTDAPVQPDKALRDFPVIGRFAQGAEAPKSIQSMDDFYKMRDKAQQQSDRVKQALKDGDGARAARIEREFGWLLGERIPSKQAKQGFMHAGLRALNKTGDNVGALRKEDVKAYESRTMTGAQKREALDRGNAAKNDEVKRAVRRFEEAERAWKQRAN